MFIIYGSRGVTSTVATGQFFCPQCGSVQAYARKDVRRYFSLFFIPMIPLEKTGDYVECQRCRGTFKPEVLAESVQRDLREEAGRERVVRARFDRAVKRAMFLVARSDGPADEKGIDAIAAMQTQARGSPVSAEDIRAELAAFDETEESVLAELAELGEDLSDERKELLLQAAAMVATASGPPGERQRAAVHKIARALPSERLLGLTDTLLSQADRREAGPQPAARRPAEPVGLPAPAAPTFGDEAALQTKAPRVGRWIVAGLVLLLAGLTVITAAKWDTILKGLRIRKRLNFAAAKEVMASAREDLAKGDFAGSAISYDRVMAVRQRHGKVLCEGRPFEAWCSQWEQEYRRQVAEDMPAVIDRAVARELPLAELVDFLDRHSTPELRERLRDVFRSNLERLAAVGAEDDKCRQDLAAAALKLDGEALQRQWQVAYSEALTAMLKSCYGVQFVHLAATDANAVALTETCEFLRARDEPLSFPKRPRPGKSRLDWRRRALRRLLKPMEKAIVTALRPKVSGGVKLLAPTDPRLRPGAEMLGEVRVGLLWHFQGYERKETDGTVRVYYRPMVVAINLETVTEGAESNWDNPFTGHVVADWTLREENRLPAFREKAEPRRQLVRKVGEALRTLPEHQLRKE